MPSAVRRTISSPAPPITSRVVPLPTGFVGADCPRNTLPKLKVSSPALPLRTRLLVVA